jgi:hypothetical protein
VLNSSQIQRPLSWFNLIKKTPILHLKLLLNPRSLSFNTKYSSKVVDFLRYPFLLSTNNIWKEDGEERIERIYTERGPKNEPGLAGSLMHAIPYQQRCRTLGPQAFPPFTLLSWLRKRRRLRVKSDYLNLHLLWRVVRRLPRPWHHRLTVDSRRGCKSWAASSYSLTTGASLIRLAPTRLIMRLACSSNSPLRTSHGLAPSKPSYC